MTNPENPPSDVLSELTARTVETFSQWADANQKVLRTLVELSASTAREGVRLYAEMQSTAMEALKEGGTYLRQRQHDLADAGADPMGASQRWLLDSVDGAQRGVRLLEGAAEAVTRSGERLRTTAERAAQEIQAALADLGAPRYEHPGTSTPV